MATSLRRGPTNRAPLHQGEALALVDDFFDALGYFAGEVPSIHDLKRLVAPDAEIFDGAVAGLGARRSARGPWLERVRRRASRGAPAEGRFLEATTRIASGNASEVRIGCVVREVHSRGRSVEFEEALRCELFVRRVRGQIVIRRVVMEHPQRLDASADHLTTSRAMAEGTGEGRAKARAARRP